MGRGRHLKGLFPPAKEFLSFPLGEKLGLRAMKRCVQGHTAGNQEHAGLSAFWLLPAPPQPLPLRS